MASPLGRRVVGAFFGVLMLALGLSACTSPSSVVASIGDETITVDEFDKALQAAYDDPIVGEAVKESGEPYKTAYLSQLLQYEVVQKIAADQDIEISQAAIDELADEQFEGASVDMIQQQYAMQGQYLTKDHINMLLTQQYVQAKVGEKASGKSLEETTAEAKTALEQQAASQPGLLDNWDVMFVSVTDPAQGQTWVDEINAGTKTIEEVGAEAGPNQDGTPQPSPTSLSGEDAQGAGFLEQMTPLETGDAGLLELTDQSMGQVFYVLVQVTERTPGDLDELAATQAEQTFTESGATAVADASNDIDIEINPRYGKLERPEEGLPSVASGDPGTFSEPTTSAPAGGAGIPGM